MKHLIRPLMILIALFFAGLPSAWAETSYDPYDNEPRYAQSYDEVQAQKSDSVYSLLNCYTFPLRAGRVGAEKVLSWAENTHFLSKAKWFWEDVLHENGFYPEARFSPDSPGIGPGGHIEFEKLLKFDKKIPFFKLHAGGGMSTDLDADANASYEFAQENGLQLYHRGIFLFDHRADDTFYGLGPRSSRGDGVDYEMNTMTLKTQAGFHPFRTFDLGGEFKYRHVTVQNTGRDDKADIENYYTINDLPGLDGGKIVSVGSYLTHDTRDFPDDPTKGGIQRFSFDFNRDTAHGDNYFKYLLELTHYFRLWSERRVFVTEFFAEHVQDVNNSSIPFFDMARVGGYGIQPLGSATHRGYKYNRWFDKSSAVLTLEYRYNIWQYGNLGADWDFFTDIGKVYGDLHEFGVGGMKVSYGTGIRFKAHKRVFLSLEVAHSSEGTTFYCKTKTPF